MRLCCPQEAVLVRRVGRIGDVCHVLPEALEGWLLGLISAREPPRRGPELPSRGATFVQTPVRDIAVALHLLLVVCMDVVPRHSEHGATAREPAEFHGAAKLHPTDRVAGYAPYAGAVQGLEGPVLAEASGVLVATKVAQLHQDEGVCVRVGPLHHVGEGSCQRRVELYRPVVQDQRAVCFEPWAHVEGASPAVQQLPVAALWLSDGVAVDRGVRSARWLPGVARGRIVCRKHRPLVQIDPLPHQLCGLEPRGLDDGRLSAAPVAVAASQTAAAHTTARIGA
mmetsp:Transcript_102026/g.283975  ORF Transcript_102026/g.283975 Transcript_102026/m.283975 type:complete len:282 (+) Transcript_102026:1545-2390(+)